MFEQNKTHPREQRLPKLSSLQHIFISSQTMQPPPPPSADQNHTRYLSGAERDANAEADSHFQKGEEEANVNEDYSAAMLHYHMALKFQRDVMGHDHPIVATTLNSIGVCLMKSGDTESASAALREALYIRQEELRDVADDVAETLRNLSILQEVAYSPKQEVPEAAVEENEEENDGKEERSCLDTS